MALAARSSEAKRKPTANGQDVKFEISMQKASSVLDLCRAHLTPPTPNNYEVWHYYLDGHNADLIESIEEKLSDARGSINEYELQQLHNEYIGKSKLESDVFETSQGMGEELKTIQDMLKSYAKESKSFGDTLTASLDELSSSSTAEQITQSLQCILRENERMQRETQELRSSVQQSQSQISTLEERLSAAVVVSQIDPLTQLHNRRYYDDELPKAIVRATLERLPLCLAIADIDHFKNINDTFGHQIGDGVLKMFADLLSKNVKGRDLVARFGGEEFVIVFEETTLHDAAALLEKIRSKLERTSFKVRKTEETIGKVTSSFGLTSLKDGDDPETLFSRADDFLYKAKETGRNKIVLDYIWVFY